jgi:hypothetical protein
MGDCDRCHRGCHGVPGCCEDAKAAAPQSRQEPNTNRPSPNTGHRRMQSNPGLLVRARCSRTGVGMLPGWFLLPVRRPDVPALAPCSQGRTAAGASSSGRPDGRRQQPAGRVYEHQGRQPRRYAPRHCPKLLRCLKQP